MTSPDLRPDDRETLSALFDGELDGDARLFALRRLGHDADWQAGCGRWQLIGDALRRQAPIAAPGGFAERVSLAVAATTPPEAAAPARAVAPAAAPLGRRVRWIGGGALAASIALAVVLSGRLAGPEAAPAAPVVASAAPVAPASTRAEPAVTQPPPPVAAAAWAATGPEAPSRTVDVASPEPRRTLAVAPPRRVPVAGARRAAAPASDAPVLAAQPANPFNLEGDATLTVRPWPRASLADGASAFTARYGTAGESAGERPSFYPFEPRLHGEAEQVPTP